MRRWVIGINKGTYLEDQTDYHDFFYPSLDLGLNKEHFISDNTCSDNSIMLTFMCQYFIVYNGIVNKIWKYFNILTSLQLEAELFLLISKVTGRCTQQSHSYGAGNSCNLSWSSFCRTNKTEHTVTAQWTFIISVYSYLMQSVSFRMQRFAAEFFTTEHRQDMTFHLLAITISKLRLQLMIMSSVVIFCPQPKDSLIIFFKNSPNQLTNSQNGWQLIN